ncbi:MAG: hypothetical protein ACUVQY_03980 [Thermoproteota archaeon]
MQTMLIGITITMVQTALVLGLTPTRGEKATAMACLIGQALSTLAMFFAPSLWMIYPITVLKSTVSSLISTMLMYSSQTAYL